MKILQSYTIFENPYNFMDGQYRYLSDNGLEITLTCANDKRASDFARRNNINFYPIEFVRTINPIDNLKCFIKLFRLVKKEKFDVVVGNMTMDSLMLMIIGKLLGIRNRIYYRHGLLYTTQTGLKRWIMKKEELFVSSIATINVEVSPSVASLVAAEKIAKKEKQIIFHKGTCNGIDALNRYSPSLIEYKVLQNLKVELKIEEEDLVFGFCGRFCKDKGMFELVEAFEKFCTKYPEINTKLLLIGALDTRDCIPQSLVESINNNTRIITTGKIDKAKIPYYYSCMNVFILPSHREGFPTVVLEASSMGIPVLTTKAHGCVDSIVDGYTGFYVGFSSDEICHGMEKMISKETRTTLGIRGRKWVRDNFDHSIVWPEVLSMYRGLKN